MSGQDEAQLARQRMPELQPKNTAKLTARLRAAPRAFLCRSFARKRAAEALPEIAGPSLGGC